MQKTYILGVGFDNFTLESAVDCAVQRMEQGSQTIVVTPNSEIVYACHKDEKLLDMINRADIILPDGIGIVYASKILKTPIKQRIAGIDFAEALLEKAAKQKYSVFLLGAKPHIAEQAAQKLTEKYEGLSVAGTMDGYFSNDEAAIDAVNKSGADIVFVCLGFPKQEYFMFNNRDKIKAKLMVGLGGSLDVFSGNVKRAPQIFKKLGLEWFYRLLKQPKRFFRVLKLPAFILCVMKNKLLKNKKEG